MCASAKPVESFRAVQAARTRLREMAVEFRMGRLQAKRAPIVGSRVTTCSRPGGSSWSENAGFCCEVWSDRQPGKSCCCTNQAIHPAGAPYRSCGAETLARVAVPNAMERPGPASDNRGCSRRHRRRSWPRGLVQAGRQSSRSNPASVALRRRVPLSRGGAWGCRGLWGLRRGRPGRRSPVVGGGLRRSDRGRCAG
jgi:hypothetical protein